MGLKKTVVLIALAGMGLAVAGVADAGVMLQPGGPMIPATGANAIRQVDNGIGIAATGTLMNYQEHITPGPSDTESGWMPGFAVHYDVLTPSNIYVHLGYSRSSGGIQYLGATQGGTPTQTTDDATIQRFLGKVGYSFWLAPNMAVTPYVAAGYQWWNRDLQGIGAAKGYTEDYHSPLIGAGALFQYSVMPRLVLSADAEMLAVTGGGMTPHIDDGLFGSAHFGTTGEERVGLQANYRVSGPWSVFGGLSFTHFNYTGGALNAIHVDGGTITGREPFSATNLFGMDAGVAYHF